jgi:hypothetical protein
MTGTGTGGVGERSPTRDEMMRAYYVWKAFAKPPVWHPIFNDGDMHIPIRFLDRSLARDQEQVVPIVTRPMTVSHCRTWLGDTEFGYIVGRVGRYLTLLEGPWRIDDRYERRRPSQHTDTELWLAEDIEPHAIVQGEHPVRVALMHGDGRPTPQARALAEEIAIEAPWARRL